ncbi:MAG: hypothetical protein C7B46_13615 [Sulfobacillus benefaciens]|uniref:Carbohydrate kinase n=1 Tax=Sulfobacillus benefaciens TaxID=453960 RepID=A0A2T2XDN9_9FIRM|nr:MAG: hypothetical protein C7B46_13615 [Sulfobacillus benefaciens]
MASYVGIDVGTSSVKVGLLTDAGAWSVQSVPVFESSASLKTGTMDVEAWWTATLQALHNLGQSVSLEEVTALAVIGNTPTLICLDGNGDAVYPAILWSDTRAEQEAHELLEEHTLTQWNRIYGTYIPISGAYPSAKLRWLQKHEPWVIKRTAKIVQPKDFVNYRLTQVIAGDHWTSKGLVSLDRHNGLQPLEAIGLDQSLAPPCHRPVDTIGYITTSASNCTGLPQGVSVMAGWSDTLGAVLSLGLKAGDGFILSGTSDSIGMITEQSPLVTEALLCAPVWDTGYAILYGPTSSGLSTLTWADEALGPSLLAEIPETILPSAQRPLFVPYVLGQRSPIWNDRIRGAWFDVDVLTTRTQLGDAVLEGVVNAERDVLEAVTAATGTPCTRLVVTGGGSRVVRLNQWRTAIFDAPLWEGASDPVLGAALIAYWGTHPHAFPSPEIIRSSLDRMRQIKPVAQFTSRYERYRHAKRSLVAYTLAEGMEPNE